MVYDILMDFVELLKGIHKISKKNVKLMASILVLIFCLESMLYLFNFFSTKPLITDLLVKQTFLLIASPQSPEFFNLLIGMKEDIKIFIGVEWIFFLAAYMVTLLLSIATIFASAITYGGKNISMKDLLLRTMRSWKRPFVTGFYTALFGIGYNFLFLAILLSLMLIVERSVAIYAIYSIISILALIFYAYLSVVWTLAFVISVLEERSGIEALGKAAQIVKGTELQGFLLNLLFTILTVILFQGLWLISFKQSTVMIVIIGLLVVNSVWLVRMFVLMAYTVVYYRCKKTHGEEVELHGSTEYVKIPSAPLINENIP